MQRLKSTIHSTLGKTIRARFNCPAFKCLREHLAQDRHAEQFAFGLFSQAKTADGATLIVRDLFLPDEGDLSEQSGGGVAPTKEFQSIVYLLAEQRGLGIMDIHTHPHQGAPRFSGIDQARSAANARYICERFAAPATHAMIVFGSDITAHDAVVFDRSLEGYRMIDAIDVLGRGTQLRLSGERGADVTCDSRYSRQAMIPGWDQLAVARQRIVIAGAGGNGAQIMQTLVSIGAGTEGWIAVADPDSIEESNLPRIPYAYPEHIGSPKVTVAAQYAGHKNSAVRFYPYPCSITEEVVADRVKAATVLIGAGDNDGLRKVCNELAVRHQIPYIDLGCDIQVDEHRIAAGGQARLILPGVNACLVCCNGYDPSQAAIDLMDDERAAVHAARGYVRGGKQTTPSVANLNAHTAQLGVAVFLALVQGGLFGEWDYAHFDQLSGETIVARTKRREDCPLCGKYGVLAMGDQNEARVASEPSWARVATDEEQEVKDTLGV